MSSWQLRMFGEHPNTLRVASLVTGCLCIIMSGSIEAFGSYGPSVKAQYNYSQYEVDLLAAMSAMGVNFGYPSGYAMERLGNGGSLLLALGLSCGGSLLIWHSTHYMAFYSNKIYLLAGYYFLFGFGVMFSHMTPLAVNMANYPAKHRGKVVAVLISAYNIGASLLSLVYFRLFIPSTGLVQQGDLSGYMLTVTVAFAASSLLAVVFTGEYPSQEERDLDEEFLAVARELDERAARKTRTWRENLAFLGDPDFQLICWGYVLVSGVTYSFRTNVLFYLASFGHQHSSEVVTVVQPIVAIGASIGFSALSDAIKARVPRSAILLGLSAVLAISVLLAYFFVNNLVFFYWLLVVMLTCDGVAWTLTPTLLSDYFGRDVFARAWGMCTLFMSFVCLVCLEVFGKLYDTAKGLYYDPVQCHGLHCYAWSTLFFLALLVITCTLYAVLLWRALAGRGKPVTDADATHLPAVTEDEPLTKAMQDRARQENDNEAAQYTPSYESTSNSDF